MTNILVRVKNRFAQLMSISHIICGNSDYHVQFFFDDEWNAYAEKTARFVFIDRNCVKHWIDAPITDNLCTVPVLSDLDWVEVGVYAGDIRTTTGARIACARCITDGNPKQAVQEFDVYNHLMLALNYRQRGNDAMFIETMQEIDEYMNEIYGGGAE